MTQRDDYVNKMKTQLDQWNAEIGRWEEKAKEAQAGMQAEAAKQLEALRARREEALYQMKLMQNASTDAWTDMMRGTDAAWKAMQDAFASARSHFDKK
ncbi:MAG TPA: hypothetical protein VIS77_04295 [Burkholderiales bacterium]